MRMAGPRTGWAPDTHDRERLWAEGYVTVEKIIAGGHVEEAGGPEGYELYLASLVRHAGMAQKLPVQGAIGVRWHEITSGQEAEVYRTSTRIEEIKIGDWHVIAYGRYGSAEQKQPVAVG